MAVDWNMAAVAAALAVFAVPYCFITLCRFIIVTRAKSRRCIRLKWEDIPVGRVHDCVQVRSWVSCYHNSHHERANACWRSQSSLACIFNRAWRLSEQRPCYVKNVPEELPAGAPFICSDARTILGFLLCTVTAQKEGDGSWEAWHPESLTYGPTKIICETINEVRVAHIQGRFREERQTLTKHELARMLEGYPPWYREKFKTREGKEAQFPITSVQDIPRAGWILAVGLMDENIETQKPLALYRCPEEPKEPGFRQSGVIYRQAVIRCRDHISKNILPHFPTDRNVKAAIVALDHLIDERTGSGMPTHGEFEKNWTSVVPHLRSSDYRFLCSNFNSYSPLSAVDKAKLEPVLLSTMAAAVHGAYEVVQYLKDTGMPLKVPLELLPFNREVWLRDCSTRLPRK